MRNFNSELKLLKKVFLNVSKFILKNRAPKILGRAPKILYVSALLAPLQKV